MGSEEEIEKEVKKYQKALNSFRRWEVSSFKSVCNGGGYPHPPEPNDEKLYEHGLMKWGQVWQDRVNNL